MAASLHQQVQQAKACKAAGQAAAIARDPPEWALDRGQRAVVRQLGDTDTRALVARVQALVRP